MRGGAIRARFSDNAAVGHTRIDRVAAGLVGGSACSRDNPVVRSRTARQASASCGSGSMIWHSPRTVARTRRYGSRGPQRRRDRSGPSRDRYPSTGRPAASRDAAGRCARAEWSRRNRRRRLHGRRPDRRGQAPKGTGGMPRRHQDSGVEGCEKSGGAAQRASIPECPSRPGELKHLSTRRKRNQPRLPQ